MTAREIARKKGEGDLIRQLFTHGLGIHFGAVQSSFHLVEWFCEAVQWLESAQLLKLNIFSQVIHLLTVKLSACTAFEVLCTLAR